MTMNQNPKKKPSRSAHRAPSHQWRQWPNTPTFLTQVDSSVSIHPDRVSMIRAPRGSYRVVRTRHQIHINLGGGHHACVLGVHDSNRRVPSTSIAIILEMNGADHSVLNSSPHIVRRLRKVCMSQVRWLCRHVGMDSKHVGGRLWSHVGHHGHPRVQRQAVLATSVGWKSVHHLPCARGGVKFLIKGVR